MKGLMEAYIDSFHAITVLVDKAEFKYECSYYILDVVTKRTMSLEVLNAFEEEYNYKVVLKFVPSIELYKEYLIYTNTGLECKLFSGSVIRTKEFEDRFKYDGPLGFEYSEKETIFRVWSPVAKEVTVDIFAKNGKKITVHFEYEDLGLWVAKVKKNLDGVKYLLSARVNGKLESFLDPYGVACDTNSKHNYVIDKNKLYKFKYQKPEFSGIYTDAIIYEASVRDLTADIDSNKMGTFLGMLEDNKDKPNTQGINYIKSLGVTHLQLLPVFDFEGVDDVKKDSKYNWGYNPRSYLVPSGWYSINPEDPYSRINELRELVDNIHQKGLRVIFDVVFNHVFKWETYGFEKLVPGFFFRVEADGNLSNATGCGNVIATERYMVRRYVKEALMYYADTFGASGFRFDLMGLLDVDTLNVVEKELAKREPNYMLYGEGWNMANPLPDEQRPHMYNYRKVPNYAFFNDRFRDYVRGSQWGRNLGFTFGVEKPIYDLTNLLSGSCLDFYKFDNPCQSLNYVECHDNYTFYDFAHHAQNIEDDKVIEAELLATEMILVAQGIPFIHGGQEFFRTKQGVENSYRSKGANKFDYARRDKYNVYVDTIRDLISIRRDYPEFRFSTKHDIEYKIHALDGLSGKDATACILEGNGYNLYVMVRSSNERIKFDFDGTLIFDGVKRQNKKITEFVLDKPGVFILRKDKVTC